MFIVLYKCSGLFQVFTREVLLEHVEKLGDDRDAILAYDHALHLNGANPGVPVMLANVSYRDTLSRICVENLFNKIFAVY